MGITDPRPDTKEEQRAQRHGLNGMRAAQGNAYLGLTAQQADTVKALPMRKSANPSDYSASPPTPSAAAPNAWPP